MGKLIRYAIYALLLLVLLLLIVPMLISSERLKALIEEQASQAGLTLQLETASLHLLPEAEVRLVNVQVSKSQYLYPAVSLASAEVSVDFLPLLVGKVQLKGIRFSDIDLHLPPRDQPRRLHFDNLSGELLMEQGRAILSECEIGLYGGKMALNGSVFYENSVIGAANAVLKVSGVQAELLLGDIASRQRLSGTLSAELTLASQGLHPAATQSHFKVDGPVRVRSGKLLFNGLLVAYDLIRFDLQGIGNNHYLKNLELYSPLIDAAGYLNVLNGYTLNGRIRSAALADAGGEMMVAGNIDHPQIIPLHQQ